MESIRKCNQFDAGSFVPRPIEWTTRSITYLSLLLVISPKYTYDSCKLKSITSWIYRNFTNPIIFFLRGFREFKVYWNHL
jgi:hypothetical protein